MGYYTDFELKVVPDTIADIVDVISQISDYEWGDSLAINAQWYDWSKHMKELSKRYPNHMFQLDGFGEEGGDIWRVYFKNGKHQDANAEVRYDDFDERLLE